ncbi:MAG: hypothetical protein V1760_01745 [Candidatus Peregrinibacteria bacterium]
MSSKATQGGDKKLAVIDGKETPFTEEEMVKVLRAMKKAARVAGEEIESEDEAKETDKLLDEINNL